MIVVATHLEKGFCEYGSCPINAKVNCVRRILSLDKMLFKCVDEVGIIAVAFKYILFAGQTTDNVYLLMVGMAKVPV